MINSLPSLPNTRISGLSSPFSLALLAGVLGGLCATSASAQTLTFTGATPSVDFGSANLCKTGGSNPAPCGKTMTLEYKVTAAGTLGTPKVLTLGATNRDFKLANGTTCIGGVTVGEVCSVDVNFTPEYPGTRPGGVQIVNLQGKVLATTFVYGEGDGPQISFSPGTAYGISVSTGVNSAFDGEGDLFVPASSSYVYKIPADRGPVTEIPILETGESGAVAVDGAGDLYVFGYANRGIVAVLPEGASQWIKLPFPANLIETLGFGNVAVDKFGDVILIGSGYGLTPTEMILAPGALTPTVRYFGLDVSVYSVDYSGDILAGTGANGVGYGPALEIPAGSDTAKTLPFTSPGTHDRVYWVNADGVGNIFASYSYNSPVNGLPGSAVMELPLGAGPQFEIPFMLSFNTATAVRANGDLFFDGVEIERSKATLNFGLWYIGDTTTLPLGITNTGNRPLVLSTSYNSPSYKIIGDSPSGCTKSIAPGAVCTLTVQFSALSEGDHNITLTLGSNGAPDATILLEGTGVVK